MPNYRTPIGWPKHLDPRRIWIEPAHVPAAINAQFLSDLSVNPEHLGKVAAALKKLRPVKGNFMSYLSKKELPPDTATILQFAKKEVGIRLDWVRKPFDTLS